MGRDRQFDAQDKLVAHITAPPYIRSNSWIERLCNDAEFTPCSDRYAVIIVQIERWNKQLNDEPYEAIRDHFFLLYNMLSDLLGQKDQVIPAEKDFRMVCLMTLEQSYDDFCESVRSQLLQLMEVLEAEFNISVTISVGPEVEGLEHVSGSYQSADDALWYNNFLGLEQQILFYNDCNDETAFPMIRSELTELDRHLIQKLQQKDITGVKYVLHQMIDREFIQTRPTLKIFKIRLGGICCKILDALEDIKVFLGDELYYKLDPGPKISQAGSLSELTAAMDDIFDEVEAYQQAAEQGIKPQWIDAMTDYINENYSNENLGLAEVSAVFNITPSYATRIYKQYTGRGIYETIQSVRLTAAKRLLNTEKTMKEIAEAVGYSSFLSMNRAFKKYEGTTPSRFKEVTG